MGSKAVALQPSSAERQPNRVIKATTARSEEHTSELQSLAYLVCRLLLEKKKIAEHSHQPCGRHEHNGCDVHQRGLTGADVADQTDDLARLHHDDHVVEGEYTSATHVEPHES